MTRGAQKPVSGVKFDSAAAHRRRSSQCDFSRIAVPVAPEIECLESADGSTVTIVKRYDPQTGTTTKTTTTRRPSTTSGLNALRAIEKNLGFGKTKRVSGDEEMPDETRRRFSVNQNASVVGNGPPVREDDDEVFKTAGSGVAAYGGVAKTYGGGSVEFGSTYQSVPDLLRRRSSETSRPLASKLGKDHGMDMYHKRASKPDVVSEAKGNVSNGDVATPTAQNRRQLLYNNSRAATLSSNVPVRPESLTTGSRRNSSGASIMVTRRKDSNSGLDAFRAYEKELNKKDTNNNRNSGESASNQLVNYVTNLFCIVLCSKIKRSRYTRSAGVVCPSTPKLLYTFR